MSGRKRLWGLGIAILAIALGAVGIAAFVRSDPLGKVPVLGPSARQIVPGIFMLGGLSPSVAYVVETTEGLILIDAGLDADARRLKAEMGALGLDWRRIRAILLTHVHGDHSGGARHLRAATGAKVYAGRGDVAVLEAGGPREAYFSTYDMPGRALHPTPVDVPLGGGETVQVGDVRFQAIAAPGHTPGSLCYLAERDGLRAIFSGDVIMMLRGDEPPRSEYRKPLGTYAAYLAPRFRGDARAYLGTLKRLRALPAPDLLLPGHPGADPRPESPRLSGDRWEELLARGIRDMETLLGRYAADGADFLDGRPKALLPGLDYLGDRDGVAVFGLEAGEDWIVINAPGGEGLDGFVRDRRRELGRSPATPSMVWLTACDGPTIRGLGPFVAATGAVVVASSEGLPRLRSACPPGTSFRPAESLRSRSGLHVWAIPLGGRGVGPLAYRVVRSGKVVLVTGEIPIAIKQDAGARLFDDFRQGRGDADAFLGSLARLRAERPNLWLPAEPADAPNANLYDDAWGRLLEDNRIGIELNRKTLKR